MATVNSDLEEYKKDSRTPCKYGSKCYQKNSSHHSKYKHPPKDSKRKIDVKNAPSKKTKFEEHDKEKKDGDREKQDIEDSNSNGDEGEPSKRECISDSPSESEQSDSEDNKNPVKELTIDQEKEESKIEQAACDISDPKVFIKETFLVNMPEDFYSFWEFCKELKPNNPCDALKDVGLKLVGAYDVLAGNFNNVKKSPEEYLRHWRYYYDPPELHTVLKGDNSTGYHIGYFFDSPDEPPAFLVSNHGMKNGVLTKMGDNIFAAVCLYLEELKKASDPFKKLHVRKLLNSIKTKAEKLNLNTSAHSEKIKKRDNKIITKTFNKVGLVVPYNGKTQLGYRDLAMSDKELMTLLNKLDKASPEEKSKYLSDLQPVLTYANIALDECDFGTGVKLGWELLYHGIDSLNSTILQFLSNSYKYLKRDAFARIAEAHLMKRKKGCDLSIL